ncbi:hypothetical protein [Salirhabdus salicampi]|uniref:hypothetical protein n=1 Tax=Salirhabdus salicampi TaxID=476102 RepID=UPI0020C3C8E0|nr:hypothetical protein [Salirhabdus salicampi]MCP8615456.1 hypothetical protein [Salirhabdus salicampi]
MRWIILIVLMVVLVGCESEEQYNINDHSAQKPEAIMSTENYDDLNMKLEMTKQHFTLNDEIVVQASITNNGNEAIEYRAGSSSCVTHMRISIKSKETGRNLIQKPQGKVSECTDDIHTELLKPGKTVQTVKTFLPKEYIYSREYPASGGVYEVNSLFRTIEEGGENTLIIKETFTIEGTNEQLMTKEGVINKVNEHPEVLQWIKSHSGEAIRKVKDGKYYILFYDGWQQVSEDTYRQLEESTLDQNMLMQLNDGIWIVEYISKLGDSPHRIKVEVDAKQGNILSVETFKR